MPKKRPDPDKEPKPDLASRFKDLVDMVVSALAQRFRLQDADQQDMLNAALQKLQKFLEKEPPASREHIKAFLFLAMGNYLKDKHRRRTALSNGGGMRQMEWNDDTITAYFRLKSPVEAAELFALLLPLIGPLPQRDRDILECRLVRGWNVLATASVLDIGKQTVMNRMSGALARFAEEEPRIRQLLRGDIPPPPGSNEGELVGST